MKPKFPPIANHAIQIAMIVGSLLLIVYNKYLKKEPLTLEDLAPLTPYIGTYYAALKAHSAESSNFITARQVICILEMRDEYGVDVNAIAKEVYGVELRALTRKQASQMISVQIKRAASVKKLAVSQLAGESEAR